MLEAFGGIKELKVNGFEKEYIKRFSIPAKTFAFNQAASTVISEMPRFILESIMFGGLILIVLYLMAQSGSFTDVIPLITLYAFAGYRLMPAAQQMYGSISKLSFVKPVLDSMYNELKELNSSNLQNFNEIKAPNDRNILECRKEIILKNVIFSYPNNSRTALKNINLKISANTIIGLIGVTGSGKTTIVDVILGLLQPQNGNLEVDGQKITQDNCKLWQKTIGYVPQNIFLSDDTIASNIAFGINNENINQEAVEQAAKKAAIHEFIVNELPQKYKTIIGERGIRLSGGERQRIGIARALYSNPSVVIFDEATNALDNKTEKKVTDAISKIGNNCTIILIAHRLETVKNCDMIYLLEKGEIKDQGKFEKLIDNKQNLYGK
jgi:ABC-type multidrug transport system fused ATPase/permease subunit